jgi:hypothetical protein
VAANKTKIFEAIMGWDFDLASHPCLTIVQRFARDHTNDLGEQLSQLSAEIIANEFKKFFFLVCVHVADLEIDNILSATKQDSLVVKKLAWDETKKAITCPFPCPPILDRFWDHLTLYNDNYEKFCTRFLPKKANILTRYTFSAYESDERVRQRKLEEHKSILKPFMNLWPTG